MNHQVSLVWLYGYIRVLRAYMHILREPKTHAIIDCSWGRGSHVLNVRTLTGNNGMNACRGLQIEDNLPQALALFELSGCYDRKATVQELFALHGFPREH